LLDEFSAAAIFALAPIVQPDGDRDGVPNVILEAMAAGLPVVASAVSGIPEMVEHCRTGLLVSPADPESLAHGLERLLTDDELRHRLGETARAFALANLSIARSVEPLAQRLSALSANGRLR
jgi:glycosyltransferase involved in cell wall biosynthesis